MAKYILFKTQDLKDYIVRFLTHLDVPEADARTAAEVLVAADLRTTAAR